MQNHRGSEYVALAASSALLLLVLIGGGFAFWQWQRNTMAQRVAEIARMEAEQQRALAQQAIAEKLPATVEDAELDSGSKSTEANEIAAIKEALLAQQAAWNKGDIDAFMETYWKSDGLTFISGGSTTHSWQGTIDGYKKKYTTPEAMGTLNFSDLQVHPLAPNSAFVHGRWDLKDKAGGKFTLIMKKLSSGWVIIHDHTSVDSL